MRGLHSILAEAILISMLITSFSILNAWQSSLHKKIINDEHPSLELLSCDGNKALILVVKGGKLQIKSNNQEQLAVYRENKGEIQIIENPLHVEEGDLIILYLGDKGYVEIGDKLLYYDFITDTNTCVLH